MVRSTIQYALWTTGPTSIRFCTVFQTTGNLGECFNDCNTILQIVTSFVELSTDLKASFPNKDDPTGGDLNYKDREDAIMKYFTYATYIGQKFPICDTTDKNNKLIKGMLTKLAELQQTLTQEEKKEWIGNEKKRLLANFNDFDPFNCTNINEFKRALGFE